MRSLLAVVLCVAAVSSPVGAQEQAALFISPMGTPSRAATTGEALSAWFAAADTDQDGRLSLEEFLVKEMPFHAVIDRNRDGIVTPTESGNLFRATAPEMYAPLPPLRASEARRTYDPGSRIPYRQRAEAERMRAARDDRPRGAGRFGLLRDIEPVMSCDADMSRWVTVAEFQQCAERRFTLLDVNGDGFFTLDESPRAQAILSDADPDEE